MRVPKRPRPDLVSQQDAEPTRRFALPRSVVMAAAGLAALAGVVGLGSVLIRPGPTGAAEDPAKVLIVSDSPADRATWLSNTGFIATQMTFAEAVALDVDGASAMARALAHADEQGIGFVAFERGAAAVDLGAVDLHADAVTPTADDLFVVLSVGDLAFPHRVSVAPRDRPIPLTERPTLLHAVLAQEFFVPVFGERSMMPPEVMGLDEQLGTAIGLQAAHNSLRGQQEAVTRAMEAAGNSQPSPQRLGSGFELSQALALADGGVLNVVRAVEVEDPDGNYPKLRAARGTIFDYYRDGERVGRCEALKHGEDPRSISAWVSASGDSVLLGVDDRVEVWTVDPNGQCSLVSLGEFARPRGPLDADARDGRVVRRQAVARGVEIWSPPSKKATRFAVPGCEAVGHPVWIGAEHIAAACLRPGDDRAKTWLALLSLETESMVAVPVQTLKGPAAGLRLLHVPHEASIRLVAVDEDSGRVMLVSVGHPLDVLLPPPGEDSMQRAPGERWPLRELPAADLAMVAIGNTDGRKIDGMAVAPDGKTAVLQLRGRGEDAGRGGTLELASLEPAGPLRAVLHDAGARQQNPSFTANSRALVWTARPDHRKLDIRLGQYLVLREGG